ncbi:MAG: hypothetical protein IJC88_02440 [Oscillospiraceae bacterium]|nr:hypothetical protein [Oscillospiraceae bacterium]
MKKSSFVAMMLGVVSGVLFALGMCMALLPEWNTMTQGILLGGLGLLLGAITVLVWRKMEHKAPIRWNRKLLGRIGVGVLGALVLGAGMCLCLVWENFLLGILVGLVGILILLLLIPMICGIQ